MRLARTIQPKGIIQRTQAALADQGYTYNESGFTYNQSGVQYGGKYGYDILPAVLQARMVKPSIVLAGDIYTRTKYGRGKLIGILGMTYR